MLILSTIFILLSNALTLRRDKAILYSRVAITTVLCCSIVTSESLYVTNLDKGIGLYGGLYHASSITQEFHIFIFLISAIILQVTGFYPLKVKIKEYCSIYSLLFYKFSYLQRKVINTMAQQFKTNEYPLIILFIITGAIFLVSTSDMVSIFLSIGLQSYGLYLLSMLYKNSEYFSAYYESYDTYYGHFYMLLQTNIHKIINCSIIFFSICASIYINIDIYSEICSSLDLMLFANNIIAESCDGYILKMDISRLLNPESSSSLGTSTGGPGGGGGPGGAGPESLHAAALGQAAQNESNRDPSGNNLAALANAALDQVAQNESNRGPSGNNHGESSGHNSGNSSGPSGYNHGNLSGSAIRPGGESSGHNSGNSSGSSGYNHGNLSRSAIRPGASILTLFDSGNRSSHNHSNLSGSAIRPGGESSGHNSPSGHNHGNLSRSAIRPGASILTLFDSGNRFGHNNGDGSSGNNSSNSSGPSGHNHGNLSGSAIRPGASVVNPITIFDSGNRSGHNHGNLSGRPGASITNPVTIPRPGPSIANRITMFGSGNPSGHNHGNLSVIDSATRPIAIPNEEQYLEEDGFIYSHVYYVSDGLPANHFGPSPRDLGHSDATRLGVSHQPYGENLQKALSHCNQTKDGAEIKRYFSEKDLKYIRELQEARIPDEVSQHMYNSTELRRALYHLPRRLDR